MKTEDILYLEKIDELNRHNIMNDLEWLDYKERVINSLLNTIENAIDKKNHFKKREATRRIKDYDAVRTNG